MHALHTGDATVASLAQPIAPAASTMKNFPEKFGTCPAHPKADHTAIECALRKADPSAFEAKVNGVVVRRGAAASRRAGQQRRRRRTCLRQRPPLPGGSRGRLGGLTIPGFIPFSPSTTSRLSRWSSLTTVTTGQGLPAVSSLPRWRSRAPRRGQSTFIFHHFLSSVGASFTAPVRAHTTHLHTTQQASDTHQPAAAAAAAAAHHRISLTATGP